MQFINWSGFIWVDIKCFSADILGKLYFCKNFIDQVVHFGLHLSGEKYFDPTTCFTTKFSFQQAILDDKLFSPFLGRYFEQTFFFAKTLSTKLCTLVYFASACSNIPPLMFIQRKIFLSKFSHPKLYFCLILIPQRNVCLFTSKIRFPIKTIFLAQSHALSPHL